MYLQYDYYCYYCGCGCYHCGCGCGYVENMIHLDNYGLDKIVVVVVVLYLKQEMVEYFQENKN